MPVVVVKLPGLERPAVFSERPVEELLEELRKLSGAPELRDQFQAADWLRTLPEPSGWFPTASIAADHVTHTFRLSLHDS